MLYADASEKLRLSAKISLETKTASKAMQQILKKNKEEFYDSMAARYDAGKEPKLVVDEMVAEESQAAAGCRSSLPSDHICVIFS